MPRIGHSPSARSPYWTVWTRWRRIGPGRTAGRMGEVFLVTVAALGASLAVAEEVSGRRRCAQCMSSFSEFRNSWMSCDGVFLSASLVHQFSPLRSDGWELRPTRETKLGTDGGQRSGAAADPLSGSSQVVLVACAARVGFGLAPSRSLRDARSKQTR